MALKEEGEGAVPQAKKRKRVGFIKIDSGVEANECLKIFLVRSPDEVGKADIFCADRVDIGHFFGEDGKIYGYKDLKINVWLSVISFHAYADITFESKSDGGKGITDLTTALQSIFGESLVERDVFLQTFTTESLNIRNTISNGIVLRSDSSSEASDASQTHVDQETSKVEHQVIRMDLHSMPVGLLYSRLVPLVLLLVEGGSAIDVTDPRWEIYFVVKKVRRNSGDYSAEILGFATIYRFFHYPESVRLRISQILVLPLYQGQGHGRRLLESVNFVAESENVYDVTIEEPSDYLQYLRSCVDTQRLLAFEPVQPAISSLVSYLKGADLSKRVDKLLCRPSTNLIERMREKLKINKKQFLKCWEVLIFIYLDPKNTRCTENFRACVSDRVRCDILDKDSENNGKRLIEVTSNYDNGKSFAMFRPASGDLDVLDDKLEEGQATREEQLKELVDKEMEDITEIAQKITSLAKT